MFIVSNSLIAESGLMGATIMGVILANQKRVDIEHIVEFKEQLGILLLSVLFIVLSARVELADFLMVGWRGLALVVVLVFISRPLGVWLSTRRSDLNNREKVVSFLDGTTRNCCHGSCLIIRSGIGTGRI